MIMSHFHKNITDLTMNRYFNINYEFDWGNVHEAIKRRLVVISVRSM